MGDEITSTWTKFRGELVICFDLLRALFKDPQKKVFQKNTLIIFTEIKKKIIISSSINVYRIITA